jgi:predicted O-methyltransferase YrrM
MKQTQEIDGWFNYHQTYNVLVESISPNGIFVECGAWLGKSSSYLSDIISKKRPDITLYIVDSWLGSPAEIDTAHKLATETDIYKIFLKNMGDRKFIPIRKLSTEAAKEFTNESLDVVFIDMSHEYEDVKIDLDTWLPKVKTGGYIAGHDRSWPGVKKAILEKFNHNKKRLYSLPGDCWTYYKEGDIK